MDMIFNPALRSKARINANDIHALDHFRFQRLYISEFTFYENGRRWIRILNKTATQYKGKYLCGAS